MRSPAPYVAIATLLLLAACKADVKATVYLSDIPELATTDKIVPVPAVLSVQMVAKQTCVEKGAEAVALLGGYFKATGNATCREAGFESYLDVPIEIPVYGRAAGQPTTPPNGSVFGIAVQKDGSARTLLAVAIAGDRLSTLQASVQRKYMQKVDLDKVTVAVALNNDGRAPVRVHAGSAWINGEPQPAYPSYDLERRGELGIRLSDVANGALMRAGHYVFAFLPGGA